MKLNPSSTQPETVANDKDTAESHRAGCEHRVQKAKRSGRDQDHVIEEGPEQVLLDGAERLARESMIARATPTQVAAHQGDGAAAMATSVPVPMAMPTSAWARAGASLMPSPTMATDILAVTENQRTGLQAS